MTVYIGIDPGASGSIAIILTDGTVMFKNIDNTPKGLIYETSYMYIDPDVDGNEERVVAIEKICARPGQHATSTFTQGCNYRSAEVVAQQYCMEHNVPVYVAPQTWVAYLGLRCKTTTAERKKLHVAKALQLYPQAPIKRHDQADALLIAHWLKCQTEGVDKEC